MEFDHGAALAACAKGDREALRRLYEEESRRIMSVALRIVRRRDLAEEVVQETFIQVWQKAASFDAGLGSARGWIFTIARNKALNVVRDGAREDLVEPDVLAAHESFEGAAHDAVATLAMSSRLRQCLEAVEPNKRDSVIMAYVGGFSHGEIAALLRVPVGTAKAWVRRGLAALKDCLA
ncbi:MAG: sigma-70 family RNA polymerase sigma factor [Hyphomicrobiaceae bacterium]|nr:sigma-70 family RNA polymerase sigma factor [Hyphomicrobiaceae bacterium]